MICARPLRADTCLRPRDLGTCTRMHTCKRARIHFQYVTRHTVTGTPLKIPIEIDNGIIYVTYLLRAILY